MATMEIVVCDICEEVGKGTVRYFITTSDHRRGEADLCGDDAKPIEHLLGDPRERDPLPPAKPRKAAAKKATTRKRTSLGAKTLTLAEIEALKK